MAKKAAGKSKKLSLKGEKSKILLVGGGKMGQALLEGWLNEGLGQKNLMVIEQLPTTRRHISKHFKVVCSPSTKEVREFIPNIIIFAIKPQVMRSVLPQYVNFKNLPSAPFFISVAAGITIGFIEELLGKDARIIRAMPNLAVAIGQGITSVTANAQISSKDFQKVFTLFSAVGTFLRSSEKFLNWATAVSGSGPAYYFLLSEVLQEAAMELGIRLEDARELVIATFRGSGNQAYEATGKSFTQLREEVTSPGGTTAAALDVLNEGDQFKNLIKEAVKAAAERAEKLAK